jgi:hypothetical protein
MISVTKWTVDKDDDICDTDNDDDDDCGVFNRNKNASGIQEAIEDTPTLAGTIDGLIDVIELSI